MFFTYVSTDNPLFSLTLKQTLFSWTVKDKPLVRVNVVAKFFKHVAAALMICASQSLLEIHRLFFLLTQIIEFYKEKVTL